MKIILFGGSGMIGTGVLLECLDDPRIESVLSVGRSPSGRRHPKLRELIRSDLTEYGDVREELVGLDACFFCLGVSSTGMNEAAYHRVTFDFAIAPAEALAQANPGMKFCFVSGMGTDSTEKGRVMWARVKGKTENQLLEMDLDAYMFRPGYVHPVRGARSRTRLYQTFYNVVGPLFPLLRRLFPSQVTTTAMLGKAMIEVAEKGYAKRILDNRDFNVLAAQGGGALSGHSPRFF